MHPLLLLAIFASPILLLLIYLFGDIPALLVFCLAALAILVAIVTGWGRRA